jgi:predicted transposase/invertase (TIGR01784 family)
MELLKPTNDYVFKRIFGQKKNSDILKDLLQAILPNWNIKNVEPRQEVQLETDFITDKVCRLDILATLDDGTKVDIEMQMRNYNDIEARSLFYTTREYHQSLENGQDYIEIPKSIGIWISNFNVFNDEGPFHEIVRLRRDYENQIFTDKIEMHYLQLPKFKQKCKRISNKLEEWLTFISFENMEELKMIENEKVKKAEEELEYLSGDEAERRIAYLRETAEIDRKFAMTAARDQGRVEGRSEGKIEEKIETAKKMLAEEMDINLIIKITGLTKDEIEKL